MDLPVEVEAPRLVELPLRRLHRAIRLRVRIETAVLPDRRRLARVVVGKGIDVRRKKLDVRGHDVEGPFGEPLRVRRPIEGSKDELDADLPVRFAEDLADVAVSRLPRGVQEFEGHALALLSVECRPFRR
jgi:hypothetical protein